MHTASKKTTNFTEGSLFFRILTFALPLMASSLLSIFYNTADNIVVGRFSGDPLALAAVGSTSGLNTLVVTFLFGFAGGGAIIVAHRFGARDEDGVSRATHTLMTSAILGGILFCLVGLAVSRPMLILMGTKPELLESAVLYIQIIFLGIPGHAIYVFGAGIIRSMGNSKTPLLILSCSGMLNVLLNLLFVIVFKMSVAGVAIATIISQYASGICVAAYLISKRNECYGLHLSRLCIDKTSFTSMLRYGIPQGLQNSFFSITAIFMSSAINTFPTAAVSARAISNNIDQLCHSTIGSFGLAAVTVIGQNYGAKKPERIKRSLIYLALQTAFLGIIIGNVLLLYADKLALLFIEAGDPETSAIIDFVAQILAISLSTSFINGTWQMLSGAVRGMGRSITAMLISLIGAAVFRILWILFIFPLEPMNTITGLFMLFPCSWTFTGIMLTVACVIAYKKLKKEIATNT